MTPAREIAGLRYQATRLVVGRHLTLEQALEIASSLGAMAQGHQWWIGDLLVAVDERFGEEGSQVEAALGIAPQTALNYRWVASRVEASRRREALTFSHHAELARLEPADQEHALDHATEKQLGVRELRDFVALTWPQPHEPGSSAGGEPAPPNDLTDAELASIARRLETLRESLEAWKVSGARPTKLSAFIDGDDVDWLVRTLRWLTRGGAR